MRRLRSILAVLGLGIFAIGYTIGTGSVTSMAKAGADYGLGHLWVLAQLGLSSGALVNKDRIAAGEYDMITAVARQHIDNCKH